MRILIVWQGKYPWEVRIEKFTDAFRQQGHEVAVLCRHRGEAKGDEVLASGTRVIRVGVGHSPKLSVPMPANPVWYKALHSAMSAVSPDLVIVRDLPLAELAARVARSRGVAIVMDMAEHYPAAMRSWKEYARNPATRLLIHQIKVPDFLERRAVRLMDGVITVCDEQIERLSKSYGYPVSRMRVVNNSPKRSWFERTRKGVSSRPRIFGHHGHMTAERGLHVLLEAISQVEREVPDVELHLAGGGKQSGDVLATIERLDISSKVKNFGPYEHADLERLYGLIDIGVLPYPPNEFINHTLSNKIFDYMACGKPVITSGAVPMKRLVTDTGAGLFFEPWTSEALAATMKEALQRDLTPLAENGMKAFRERFNWEADVTNLLAFVDTILRG
jgi:glycosyltransferase involved in cell wall biosynthesis